MNASELVTGFYEVFELHIFKNKWEYTGVLNVIKLSCRWSLYMSKWDVFGRGVTTIYIYLSPPFYFVQLTLPLFEKQSYHKSFDLHGHSVKRNTNTTQNNHFKISVNGNSCSGLKESNNQIKTSFKESLFTRQPYLQWLQTAILGILDQILSAWMGKSW